tara:strand:- start:1066 stop:1260 length:195 start_codon:yes stop_codon:yes gene_type:complete
MIKKTKQIDIKKIKSELFELKKNLLNLRFQKSTGQLEKTSNIKKTRKKIAKIKTEINAQGETNA